MPIDKSEILTALISALVGWVVAELFGIGKVKNKLEFIRGQLSLLVKIHDEVSSLKGNQAIITKDQTKIRKDLDAAHSAIRVLNTKG